MDKGKFIYKNISGQPQVVMNYGYVNAGGTIETDTPFENPNFELIDGQTMVGIDPVTAKPKKGK